MSTDEIGRLIFGIFIGMLIIIVLALLMGRSIDRERMDRCMALFDNRDKCYEFIYNKD